MELPGRDRNDDFMPCPRPDCGGWLEWVNNQAWVHIGDCHDPEPEDEDQ